MRFCSAGVFLGIILITCNASTWAGPQVTILPLGDSITRGFGSTDLGGYREPLFERLSAIGWQPDFVGSLAAGDFADPQHEGHDGATIRRVANIFSDRSTGGGDRGRVTLLMAGTNDAWHGTGPDAAANAPANLNQLIETIFRESGETQLFVASIPPIYNAHIGQELQAVREYNAAIPGIVASWAARGKDIHFVDVYSAMTIEDLSDGVHPNDRGYRKIADAFFDAMVSVPEPATGGLIGLSAIAVLLRRKR